MDYSRFRLPDFKKLNKRDYLLAVLTGGLVAAAFPKPEVSFLAWVAFVPLLLAAGQKTPWQAFKLGFVAGIAAYAGLLYWINIVVTTYGKLPLIVSFIVFMLLVAYLALYIGVFMYCVRKTDNKGIPMILSFPVLWVGLEYLRSFLLTGFPWASLGYSQYRILPLIQISDLAGVYGVSFLIAFGNVIIYQIIKAVVKRERTPHLVQGIVVFVVLMVASLVYGFNMINRVENGVPVKVALIQGNIDQSIKWDPAFQEATVRIYERLSRVAASKGVDLLVWPESAVPFFFQDDEKYASRIRSLAGTLKTYLVTGSPAYDVASRSITFRNSAFLISPEGEVLGRSDKIHLVPFGEYVPLAKLLPFVHKLVVGVGDFSPGTAALPLSIDQGKIGVLVCFEGIFPELSRDYVQAGSRMLVNITNDAWYGRSSAPYQHLSMTVFRAVENRVPLIRAANTGISAVIDSRGEITTQTPLFKEAFITSNVRLGDGDSLYRRYGDVFAKACIALSILLAITAFFPTRATKRGRAYV